MFGFGAKPGQGGFGPAPPRSGASSANVSIATSLGGFKKSGASSGVSSPSLDIIDEDSSRVPSMDPLPFTDDAPAPTQAPQAPLPLAPKKSAFGTTFGASTSASKPATTAPFGGSSSFGGGAGKPFNAMGMSAAAMGAAAAASSSSSSAPAPFGSLGAGTSFTSPNTRIKPTTTSTTTPISEPSPISKSSPQTANSPSVNLSGSPTPFSSPSNRKEEISISSSTNRSLFSDTKKEDAPTTTTANKNNLNSSPHSDTKKGTVDITHPTKEEPVSLSSRILSYDAAPGWDDERIKAMKASSDFNKEKLSQLDAICMIQHTADTLVCQDAGLALQRAAIEGWSAKIAEIGSILDKSEKELQQLIKENPVMGKADGEAFGESAELQDLWYDRQDEFINLFVSHRDRYLSILRSTKLVGLGKAVSAATEESRKEAWERENVGYTNNSLMGQYQRMDE